MRVLKKWPTNYTNEQNLGSLRSQFTIAMMECWGENLEEMSLVVKVSKVSKVSGVIGKRGKMGKRGKLGR